MCISSNHIKVTRSRHLFFRGVLFRRAHTHQSNPHSPSRFPRTPRARHKPPIAHGVFVHFWPAARGSRARRSGGVEEAGVGGVWWDRVPMLLFYEGPGCVSGPFFKGFEMGGMGWGMGGRSAIKCHGAVAVAVHTFKQVCARGRLRPCLCKGCVRREISGTKGTWGDARYKMGTPRS